MNVVTGATNKQTWVKNVLKRYIKKSQIYQKWQAGTTVNMSDNNTTWWIWIMNLLTETDNLNQIKMFVLLLI